MLVSHKAWSSALQSSRVCARADVRGGCAAEMYDNQDEIGRALDKLFSEGVVKRQDLWVTSKARPLTLPPVHWIKYCQTS